MTCCNAQFNNGTTAQITLTRANLIDSFSQLQNNGCNDLCDDGNPRFDLWFKLAVSATSAEAGWREINWPDNNVPDYGGGEVQDYLIYDPWDPYIDMGVYIRGDFHEWNDQSFTNQQFQLTVATHAGFGDGGLFDPLDAHNGVARGDVKTAVKISPKLIEEISTMLEGVIGNKVSINTSLDLSLIHI